MDVTSNLKVREVINQVVNDPAYKAVAEVPLISFHQIGLLLLTFLLVFGGIFLASQGLTLWLVYPLIIFGVFTSFTVLHDATHRAVSSNKFLSDFIGTIAGNFIFQFNTVLLYRYVHLTHHRYVGDKELDPDEVMVGIPAKYYPLGYIVFFLPEIFIYKWLFLSVWNRTPFKLKIVFLVSLVANIIFHILLFTSPIGYEFFIWFYIPGRMGAALTNYLFAHLPHPEGVHWHEHPFQAAYQLTGNKHVLSFLWGQSNHAMHHFLPHIPWYKYHKTWSLANGIFHKQNIPERKIFSKPDFSFKERALKENIPDQGRILLNAKVISVSEVGHQIKRIILAPGMEGVDFPAFTPGSHIRIHLPSGKVRSYSLVNPSYEKNKYQIAVKLEPDGKGGSKEIHENISEGSVLKISPPINNFVLYENVQKYILIAGGIGITPLISMAHRLIDLEKNFELHISARSAENIPFSFEFENWTFAPNTEIHLDKHGKSSMDLSSILAHPDEDSLVYICGPSGFNNWINNTALNLGWKENQIKEEVFTPYTSELAVNKPFEIKLNKSGRSISVAKEQTIIDALLINNIKVDYTCLQGTCGTCITPVLEGEIDHRDAVLTKEEKISGEKICLCVSRAKQGGIVLDL